MRKNLIYFDNSSTSYPKAPGVAEAVKGILEKGCFNINRGAYEGSFEMASLVYETRGKIARFFDAPSGRNVMFTSGATQSINIALKGLLHPGDHVITTQMEHNAVVRPLAQVQKQGVNVDVVRCGRDGKLDISDLESKITDKTKLVTLLHVSNVCGTILPIRDVGSICRRHGALLMVDAAQTAGILPISVQNDNIDILVFAGHKGLLAMQGIGGLILSQQIANKITPLIAGGTGSHSHIADMPEELPDRLEAGTLNLPGIVSLSAALEYITDIGLERIYAHEKSLLARLTHGLMHIPNVRIVGPKNPDDKCAIAALDFVGRDNAEIAALLDEQYGIMTRCGMHCAPGAHEALGTFPQGVVRCSFGHKNTNDEVDTLLAAISQIMR
jgi:cysteine desulfurase family protein